MPDIPNRIGLFIPCYIDQFYPNVAIATLSLLEKMGCNVDYPMNQTCCGQPFANSGFENKTSAIKKNFKSIFREYDCIVCPSGSCTLFAKDHILSAENGDYPPIYELAEFIADIIQPDSIDARFPFRVGLHQSCHGLRGLSLGQSSELMSKPFNKTASLLSQVEGIELMPLTFKDECCGFGGSFAVDEEAMSVAMGKDRLKDHMQNNVEVITAGDMSCLMHLEGLIKREKLPLRVMHFAEILNPELI